MGEIGQAFEDAEQFLNPGMKSWGDFAADSLLEEGVSSEPVSEARNSRRAPPVAA
jgi:hypothetical protein